jgi:LacI family repressor for deo operon, udp, cdd, tsx, nupC, and nupG
MGADESDVAPGWRTSAATRRGAVHIAEVAALAGVSTATVSRALAMPGRVSAATRERVLEVVRRTGYTPNIAGRNLRAARSKMVLVVVPSLITPFFADLLLGVDRALSAHGYGLLVGNLHDGEGKEERLLDLLLAGQADGALLLNGHVLRGATRSLADTAIPAVAVSVPAAGVPAVLVQDREGGAAAARHLLELGHRRFGYIAGPPGNYSQDERWAGYSDTLAAAGVDAAAVARYPGDFHVRTGVDAARRFLAEPVQRPTGIFAASDMMAIGFMRTVHAAGLRVPRDVSVVGFDGIEFADYCEPPLTTVRQPREAMGREAAELLVRLIRGEAIPADVRVRQLEVSLRPAASTAAPPPDGRGEA